MTSAEFSRAVLDLLDDGTPATLETIARALRLPINTTALLLAPLVKRGRVHRLAPDECLASANSWRARMYRKAR